MSHRKEKIDSGVLRGLGERAKLPGNVCGKDQSEDQGDEHRGTGNGERGWSQGDSARLVKPCMLSLWSVLSSH